MLRMYSGREEFRHDLFLLFDMEGNQHVLWQFMPDSPRQGVAEVVAQGLIFEADMCTTDSKEADRIANAIDDLLESFRSQNLTQLQAARIALRLRFPNMYA